MILVRKDSTEQFSRQAGFWKGPSLPWTNSWETSSLLNSTSSLTFSLVLSIPLPCLLKPLQYGPQPPGATSKSRRSLFCFFSDSLLLYPWSLEPQGGSLEGFETGTWKNQEQLLLTVQTWGLRNRSEPFRTVPETSAPRKLARKISSVQRIPGVGRHGQGRAIPDAVVPTWEYESSNLWTHSRTPICYIEYVFRLNDAGKNPGKNRVKEICFTQVFDASANTPLPILQVAQTRLIVSNFSFVSWYSLAINICRKYIMKPVVVRNSRQCKPIHAHVTFGCHCLCMYCECNRMHVCTMYGM